MKRISILICGIFLSLTSFGQQNEIGVFLGGGYYNGDLNPFIPFQSPHPAFGLLYRHNLNPRLSLMGSFTHGTLEGSDIKTNFIPEREGYFKTQINELAIRFEYNYLNYITGSSKSYYSTFIFGGIGAFQTADVIDLSMPFGIGFKYSIGKKWGFTIEWGMRKTMTDNIDGVPLIYEFDPLPENLFDYSQNEIDQINQKNYQTDPMGSYEEIENPINPADKRTIYNPKYSDGDQRSNSRSKDWYSFVGAAITYKFSLVSKKKCQNAEYGRKYLIK